MRKRIIAAVLTACLLCTLLAAPASAAGSSAVLQTAQALGIVHTADSTLDWNASVTRAQFAEMLAAFSESSAAASSGSLFTDVAGTHWAAASIRTVVREGWMGGYTDGSFRPETDITLEEACTAALRMLGYDAAQLTGAFPEAQLHKAAELGLRSGISRTQGQAMTRMDCVQLLHNLLTAQTSGGQTYAEALGYTVTGGEVDYTAALAADLSGPYVAGSGTALPFTPQTVYRDGKLSSSAALEPYDVYYYNAAQRTLWIYTKRIAGKITALTPNSKEPVSVTVAGNTYEIGSAAATYQLSVLSGGGVGSVVTLLLGMDGQVVSVVTGAEVDTTYYGMVQAAGRSLTTEEGADVLQSIEVLCTDGIVRTFDVDKALTYPEGWLVQVDVTGDGVSVQTLSNTFVNTTLHGTVDRDAAALGEYAFSDNVKILDTTSEGDGVAVERSRLAGYTLELSDVRFYTLDAQGRIENLILNHVTGDVYTYGYLVSVSQSTAKAGGTELSVSNLIADTVDSLLHGNIVSDLWSTLTGGVSDAVSSVLSAAAEQTGGVAGDILQAIADGAKYTYLVQGETVASDTSILYPVLAGGIAVRYNSDGSVKGMLQMTPARLDSIGANTVSAGSTTYTLADDVQVYLYKYGEYYPISITDVNAEDYILTGWYDNFGCSAGGQMRIVIALKK